jgi:hypothetical protein
MINNAILDNFFFFEQRRFDYFQSNNNKDNIDDKVGNKSTGMATRKK